MKKRIRIILVAFFVFVATGCMKVDYSMTVNKDKSVEINVIEAFNKQILESADENTTINEEELEKYKKAGYSIKEYDDGTNSGYVFYLKADDIDDLSVEYDIVAKLDLAESEDGKKYFFTVKKGLFRNKYKAVIVSEVDDSISDYEDMLEEDDEEDLSIDQAKPEEETTTPSTSTNSTTTPSTSTNNTVVENESKEDEQSLEQLTQLMSSMDAKFSIKLPYGAISSNSKNVSQDGKTLTWDLMNLDGNIEFEFYLYNLIPILIAGGILLVVLIIIIILIIRHFQNRKYLKLALEREKREQEELAKKDDSVDNLEVTSNNTLNSDYEKIEESVQNENTVEELSNNDSNVEEIVENNVDSETVNFEPIVDSKEEVANEEVAENNIDSESVSFEPIVDSKEEVANEEVEENNIDSETVSFEPIVDSKEEVANEEVAEISEDDSVNNFHVEEIITPENVNNFQVEEIVTPENVNNFHVEEIVTPENVNEITKEEEK